MTATFSSPYVEATKKGLTQHEQVLVKVLTTAIVRELRLDEDARLRDGEVA